MAYQLVFEEADYSIETNKSCKGVFLRKLMFFVPKTNYVI